MHKQLLAALLGGFAVLALVAEYFARGEAATVHAMFYLSVLALVIGVLRIVLPRRSGKRPPARR